MFPSQRDVVDTDGLKPIGTALSGYLTNGAFYDPRLRGVLEYHDQMREAHLRYLDYYDNVLAPEWARLRRCVSDTTVVLVRLQRMPDTLRSAVSDVHQACTQIDAAVTARTDVPSSFAAELHDAVTAAKNLLFDMAEFVVVGDDVAVGLDLIDNFVSTFVREYRFRLEHDAPDEVAAWAVEAWKTDYRRLEKGFANVRRSIGELREALQRWYSAYYGLSEQMENDELPVDPNPPAEVACAAFEPGNLDAYRQQLRNWRVQVEYCLKAQSDAITAAEEMCETSTTAVTDAKKRSREFLTRTDHCREDLVTFLRKRDRGPLYDIGLAEAQQDLAELKMLMPQLDEVPLYGNEVKASFGQFLAHVAVVLSLVKDVLYRDSQGGGGQAFDEEVAQDVRATAARGLEAHGKFVQLVDNAVKQATSSDELARHVRHNAELLAQLGVSVTGRAGA
ncbi:hypothetical protein [Lentzea aerocolonigenes]|nr:hypothetical protein [Lentzea aerocolonigenes]